MSFLGSLFIMKKSTNEMKRYRGWIERWVAILSTRFKSSPKALREFMYGMTAHEMDLELRKERGSLDHLFMLIVFGDLVGLPLLPPYYSMRLLPYIVPSIEAWKRSLLREKDLTDFASMDI